MCEENKTIMSMREDITPGADGGKRHLGNAEIQKKGRLNDRLDGNNKGARAFHNFNAAPHHHREVTGECANYQSDHCLMNSKESTAGKQNVLSEEEGVPGDDVTRSRGNRCLERTRSGTVILGKLLTFLATLYFFICSLDLLSAAFTLLAGWSAGAAFQSPLLQNPVCGLMIGVMTTAILQSSSTSTSIVITMVAAGILTVEMAIPIIMGANIGTSVTGVIVAVTQAGDKDTFRRAFSAATVHDMFNWLTVIILLPVEVATGYLYHVTSAIMESTNLAGGGEEQQFLSVLTDPFTELIVQLDTSVLDDIARGDPSAENKSMLLYWCEYESLPVDGPPPLHQPANTDLPLTTMVGSVTCQYLFHGTSLSDQAVGGILLVMSLFMLITCLIIMVKILRSLLQGQMASVIQKTINSNFPGKFAFLTGYVTILVGALVTVLVQSSSVVSSALTPLAGVGLVTLERVYPMMLGANIGTTSTAILAAFAASGDRIIPSFQIAMCHLFFNLTGILIWYPVPHMRKVPLKLASFLGETTATYRWFAFVYLITMFFLFPMSVFVLSLPGWWLLAAVGIPMILLAMAVAVINILQEKKPHWLPEKLQSWDYLPIWLRSLEPMDSGMKKVINKCNCCGCCDKVLQTDDETESTCTTETCVDKPEFLGSSITTDGFTEGAHINGVRSAVATHSTRPRAVDNASGSRGVFYIDVLQGDNLRPSMVFETCV